MKSPLTLGLLLRGITNADPVTRMESIDLVRAPATALSTAEQLLRDDAAAREQFGDARVLAGFLRGRAGLMAASARAARRTCS